LGILCQSFGPATFGQYQAKFWCSQEPARVKNRIYLLPFEEIISSLHLLLLDSSEMEIAAKFFIVANSLWVLLILWAMARHSKWFLDFKGLFKSGTRLLSYKVAQY
jgi:hypothetical protein